MPLVHCDVFLSHPFCNRYVFVVMPVFYFCKVFHFVVVPPFYCNKMVRPMYSNRDGFAAGALEQIEGMVRELLANCRWFQLSLPPSSRQSNACHEVHPQSAQVPSL